MFGTSKDACTIAKFLYKINPEATNGYIVETDPKFTDCKQWLSSDYMFEQLRHNNDNLHKRLGDGFYERTVLIIRVFRRKILTYKNQSRFLWGTQVSQFVKKAE